MFVCVYICTVYCVFGNSTLLDVDLNSLQSHTKPHWLKPTYLPVPPLPTNSTKPARPCVGGTAGEEITCVAALHRSLKRERVISWWCHREREAFCPVGFAPGTGLIMNCYILNSADSLKYSTEARQTLQLRQSGVQNGPLFTKALFLGVRHGNGENKRREGGEVITGSIPSRITPSECMAQSPSTCVLFWSIHHVLCVGRFTANQRKLIWLSPHLCCDWLTAQLQRR